MQAVRSPAGDAQGAGGQTPADDAQDAEQQGTAGRTGSWRRHRTETQHRKHSKEADVNGITRFVLKRPVTVLMALLCLIVFGISSVFNATLEQMPDMDQPMMIIMANYSGASPEDMDELVTQLIEDPGQHAGGCEEYELHHQ